MLISIHLLLLTLLPLEEVRGHGLSATQLLLARLLLTCLSALELVHHAIVDLPGWQL